MTHVVIDSCIACKYTDCVELCPVDCFHEGANFLVINPDECIDCGLCVSECPVFAIKPEIDLLEHEVKFMEINALYSSTWPVIKEKKAPLENANHMATIENKIELIEK